MPRALSAIHGAGGVISATLEVTGAPITRTPPKGPLPEPSPGRTSREFQRLDGVSKVFGQCFTYTLTPRADDGTRTRNNLLGRQGFNQSNSIREMLDIQQSSVEHDPCRLTHPDASGSERAAGLLADEEPAAWTRYRLATSVSDQQGLNLRPPAPKAGALPLRHDPSGRDATPASDTLLSSEVST